MADIAETLWRHHLRHDPADPDWLDRDRFVLSNGHGSMLLYALLHLSGYDLPMDEIQRFRQLHSRTSGHPVVDAPRRKAWIAAIEGLALGGGFELALACDRIVAAEGARFALPEVRRGLIASGGGVVRLPLALPRAIALELIATGAFMDATRAHALGLVNHVPTAGGALETAVQIAEAIAANAPLAVQEALLIARSVDAMGADDRGAKMRQASARVIASSDAKEGSEAFAQKRAPKWTGR